MKLLFTGDINFRGKESLTFEESKEDSESISSRP